MSAMAFQITLRTIVHSRRRSKKASKLRVTSLCEGNSPVIGEFPAQRASNAENAFTWWRHHGRLTTAAKPRTLHTPITATPAQIRENIKSPRHWPLWGKPPVTTWFPTQRSSIAENVSIWWRHHDIFVIYQRCSNKSNLVNPSCAEDWIFRGGYINTKTVEYTMVKPKNLTTRAISM